MDPLCHTLVAGCLGQSGLKRRTGLGMATLVIAANLPDLDILAIFAGRNLEFRRGWTHGVLAILVWPFLLAGLLWLWDRLRPRPDRAPVRLEALLLLSAIGVLTHPFLDFLNNYGMRWLMPFRDRWYYGDTLVIVDLWLWGSLAAGIWLARLRERAGRPDPGRPARLVLAVATAYIGLMMMSTIAARADVGRQLGAPFRFMVAPVFLTPFAKQVVVDEGATYRIGHYRWGNSPSLRFDLSLPKGGDSVAAAAISKSRSGRAFLHWARFPVFREERRGDSVVIRVHDLRYVDDRGESWAAVEATMPARVP